MPPDRRAPGELPCLGDAPGEGQTARPSTLSLGKDAPQSRQRQPPAEGKLVEICDMAGLHHNYEHPLA
jgi:hypothetical protein